MTVNNILIEALGPIQDPMLRMAAMTRLPISPSELMHKPRHERAIDLFMLKDLYLPTRETMQISESVDILIREGYRHRNPAHVQTWRALNGIPSSQSGPGPQALASTVLGLSGTGKSTAIEQALGGYLHAVVHQRFPQMAGEHFQVLRQSVEVPKSGRAADLAKNLMIKWDETTSRELNAQPRFSEQIAQTKNNPAWLTQWLTAAKGHSLGILHLDEVQNLFRLESLKARQRKSPDQYELRITDDSTLKWIISLTNTWKIPLLLSGTPDALDILIRRMSNAQRLSSVGAHVLKPLTEDNPFFTETFLKQLLAFQLVKNPISDSTKLRELLIELTYGIPRLLIAYWIAAQRIALRRTDETLKIDDFYEASNSLLAAVVPAVTALRSGDPQQINRYEDLLVPPNYRGDFYA